MRQLKLLTRERTTDGATLDTHQGPRVKKKPVWQVSYSLGWQGMPRRPCLFGTLVGDLLELCTSQLSRSNLRHLSKWLGVCVVCE